MCGRYTLASPGRAELQARFAIGEAVEVRRRFNIAPGDDVLAVTGDRDGRPRGELLRWGLVPAWAPSPAPGVKMINARLETVAEKPAYRGALRRSRCLILADGFYEWQRGPEGRRKQAFHITRADGAAFAFAGLWAVWRPGGVRAAEAAIRSCTIITRPANAAVAALHDRMPVVLAPEAEAAWLDPATPAALLAELLGGLRAEETVLRAVGPAVNDARRDGPECLAGPVEVQGSLF